VSEAEYEVVQLHSPTPQELKQALAAHGLHWPHDDLLERHRHPGARFDDGTLSLVLHTLCYRPESEHVDVIQSAAVLGQDAAVVARWDGDQLDEAFEQPHPERGPFIGALVEAVHDAAVEALTDLEERVDDCELEVLDADGGRDTAPAIYHLERELLTVRRSIGPMVGMLDRLDRRANVEGRNHIAEWRDRFVRLVAQVEDIDNLLTSVLSVNLTLVSVRQNEDMRKIAAWAAIGIAPTAIAGIYGMNFDHMPELSWEYGYPFALGLIAAVCGGLYFFFKRKGWL
jgi:magnesium transporter